MSSPRFMPGETPYGLHTVDSRHEYRKIRGVFSQYPQVEKAILYGSRATGTYRNGSDIDLTLCGNALTHSVLSRIDTELDDLLLPYTIDLSIFHQIDNPAMLEQIQRMGVNFYKKQHPSCNPQHLGHKSS